MEKAHTATLYYVEPTLFDQTGHAFSYLYALLEGNSQKKATCHFQLFTDKRAISVLPKHLIPFNQQYRLFPYFFRPLRQLQKIFLFYRLTQTLKNNVDNYLFIPTAEYLDLILIDAIAPKPSQKKITLHFHQFNFKPKKATNLIRIAKKKPGFKILTTTESMADQFRTYGFNAKAVPLSASIDSPKKPQHNTFQSILYAGAARSDKGFPHVIKTLTYFRTQGDQTNFILQTSPPHSLRYDDKTEIAIKALEKLVEQYPNNLTLYPKTIPSENYHHLFDGKICLLLYESNQYDDKCSGVALDAFYQGAPIVTTKGTWIAELVQKYHAGLCVHSAEPKLVYEACKNIETNYQTFQENVLNAAKELKKKHDPKHTLNEIF